MHSSNIFYVIVLCVIYIGYIHSINCLVPNKPLSVVVFRRLFDSIMMVTVMSLLKMDGFWSNSKWKFCF